jgi:hypothetical protein
MRRWLDALAKGRVLLFLGVLVFAFSGLVFPWVARELSALAGKEIEVPDVRFGFSPDELHQVLDELGPAGRDFYRLVELSLDVAYPLAYGLFFAGLLWFLGGRFLPAQNIWRKIALLPLLASLFDLSENVSLSLLVSRFPERMDGLAGFANVANQLKFSLVAVSIGLVLAGLIAWGVRIFTPRS